MTAFVGEGGVEEKARFGMNAGFRCRLLKSRQKDIVGLRMSYGTGCFALFTANAALGVDKDSLHYR